jgi:hypothetical protein
MPPPERFGRVYTDDRPVTLEYLAGLHQVVEGFPNRVLLGEVATSGDRIADCYGCERPRLDLPLNYRLLDAEWEPRSLAYTILITWVLCSHDKPRIASRIRPVKTRLAAMLMLGGHGAGGSAPKQREMRCWNIAGPRSVDVYRARASPLAPRRTAMIKSGTSTQALCPAASA